MKNKTFKSIYLAIISLLFMACCSCTRIDAGHVGVKVNLYGSEKGVNDVTEVTGSVFYNPFTTSIYEFPTFVQTKDFEPFTVNAKDASQFTIDSKINYSMVESSVPSVFKKYRKKLSEIEDGYLKTAVYDAYRISANSFTSDSLMGQRAKFESMVEEELKKSLFNEGFRLEKITHSIIPPQSLRDAIDAKNKAVQDALKIENKVKEEEAQAKISVARAEGESSALKIKADAEAYYNRKVSESLTQSLVEMRRIEKWNGAYPTTMAGGSPSLIMGVK